MTEPVPAADPTRSPLAAAFFLLAARERLPVGEICRPPVSFALAAEVTIQLNPWTAYADEARAEVLGRGVEVGRLAGEVLADPRSAWWWEPGSQRQIQVGAAGDLPGVPPVADLHWSAYAQRPGPQTVTSTPRAGGSGLHAALAAQVGDLDPAYPLRQVELTAADDARLYEIRHAEDWRALALGHPVHRTGADTASDPDGLTSDVAPDWPALAREWDGVHLTFGGLLAASLVPLGRAGDRTVLWTWECEQTRWLRDVFVGRVDLPPLTGPVPPAVEVGPLELAAARPRGSPAVAHLTATRHGILGRLRRPDRRRRG